MPRACRVGVRLAVTPRSVSASCFQPRFRTCPAAERAAPASGGRRRDGVAFHQGRKFLHPHLGHRILFGDAIFPEGGRILGGEETARHVGRQAAIAAQHAILEGDLQGLAVLVVGGRPYLAGVQGAVWLLVLHRSGSLQTVFIIRFCLATVRNSGVRLHMVSDLYFSGVRASENSGAASMSLRQQADALRAGKRSLTDELAHLKARAAETAGLRPLAWVDWERAGREAQALTDQIGPGSPTVPHSGRCWAPGSA